MKEEQPEYFLLSSQQKHLWWLQQKDRICYSQCAVLITGTLHKKTLEEATERTIKRHEIMHTIFSLLPEMKFPFQSINDSVTPLYRYIDMSDLKVQRRKDIIDVLLREDRVVPFDFSHCPLLRVSLITTAYDEHVLIITLPGMCADDQSVLNIVRDLALEYAAAMQAEVIFNVSFQYADYAAWQDDLLEDEDAEVGIAFWNKYLLSTPTSIVLPFEAKLQSLVCNELDSLSFKLFGNDLEQLKNFSLFYKVSLSNCILSCWGALLCRLTSQLEVPVYAICDGRKYEEFQGSVGAFSRSLPIFFRFTEGESFSHLLQQVSIIIDDVNMWQEYFPLENSLNANIDFSLSELPIGFTYSQEMATHHVAGLTFSVCGQSSSNTERFKLKLCCSMSDNAAHIQIFYLSSLYHQEDIERILAQFQMLLQSAINEPESPLSCLSLLSEIERQKLLVTWNNRKASFPEELCLHQLFEAQVELTPNVLAVISATETLTYLELNRRANQLAHYLRECGVGANTLVGICIERSPAMVIGVLAILKAGGAYVPLAPELPEARIAFMVHDTKITTLLTQEQWLSYWITYTGKIVCIDHYEALLDDENLPSINTPEDLAYVTYTSGSTGQPKGILVPHRGVVSYLIAYLSSTYQLNSTDVVLQIAALSFDASVRDIIGPLTVGASEVIINPADAKNPWALLSAIKEFQVTSILSIVPTVFHEMLEIAKKDEKIQYSSLRRILISGENLHISDCNKARIIFTPDILVVNQYGPTESTLTASYYPMTTDQSGSIALIGRPIPNLQIYILDGHLNPVPIWISGEIYIGGVGLSYGYLNRPILTGELFIPHPFSDNPGSRLYKTGDIARYLPDGNIEILGRVDQLIKYQGIRVEPAEIEDALCQHPLVKSAVVVAREYRPGNKRLIAYIVTNQQSHLIDRDAWRSFLVTRLPAYSIPSEFVLLESLPLTPNGKIDRLALPDPALLASVRRETFVAPQTQLEKRVANVWSQVLGVENIGLYDNFFSIGGHSLLATQLMYHLNSEFYVELRIRNIFDAPTVKDLSQIIESNLGRKDRDIRIDQIINNIEQLSDGEIQNLLSTEDQPSDGVNLGD